MPVIAVKEAQNHYEVRIGGQVKTLPLETKEVSVGVKIGPTGTKVWQAIAVIKPRDRVRPGQSRLTLEAFCPLNSVNGNLTSCKIVSFWEDVSTEVQSKR